MPSSLIVSIRSPRGRTSGPITRAVRQHVGEPGRRPGRGRPGSSTVAARPRRRSSRRSTSSGVSPARCSAPDLARVDARDQRAVAQVGAVDDGSRRTPGSAAGCRSPRPRPAVVRPQPWMSSVLIQVIRWRPQARSRPSSRRSVHGVCASRSAPASHGGRDRARALGVHHHRAGRRRARPRPPRPSVGARQHRPAGVRGDLDQVGTERRAPRRPPRRRRRPSGPPASCPAGAHGRSLG